MMTAAGQSNVCLCEIVRASTLFALGAHADEIDTEHLFARGLQSDFP
jgi:hypothetical protein